MHTISARASLTLRRNFHLRSGGKDEKRRGQKRVKLIFRVKLGVTLADGITVGELGKVVVRGGSKTSGELAYKRRATTTTRLWENDFSGGVLVTSNDAICGKWPARWGGAALD